MPVVKVKNKLKREDKMADSIESQFREVEFIAGLLHWIAMDVASCN